MPTTREDWPGFIEEVVDREMGRLANTILDQDGQAALREAIDNFRKEMHWLFAEQNKRLAILQAKLDANDKRINELTRDARHIHEIARNAPWVAVPPAEIPF